MAAYYNEIDLYAAQWLRNLIEEGLIADGHVDTRSIGDVTPNDLRGYTQHHFFAGIGGWSAALRLAAWPDHRPVWTGSCPCQPFSLAGKQGGFADERHLWPFWHHLIRISRPAVVFGEQVASAKVWLDQVFHDLESENYACGAAVLPACAVDAPHQRNRMWFVADAAGERQREPADEDYTFAKSRKARVITGCDGEPLANANSIPPIGTSIARPERDPWSPEPGVGRVVDGIPHKLVESALRGFGNAIVPQVAAEFIRATMDILPWRS